MLSAVARRPPSWPAAARCYYKKGANQVAPKIPKGVFQQNNPPRKARYFKNDPIIERFGVDPPLDTERTEKVVTAYVQYHRSDALLARTVSGTSERYIPMPDGVSEGDVLLVSRTCDVTPKMLRPGHRFPLGKLPIGTLVHNLEKGPGAGMTTVAKASGVSSQIIMQEPEQQTTIVKLPSGILKEFESGSLATIGPVHRRVKYQKGKAGKPRPPGLKWPR